jgi:hypothetical protein
MNAFLVVGFLSAAVSTAAPTVYKCEEGGTITYTDRPCSPSAAPHELPMAIVAQPPSATERALAREHDARIARDLEARDRADDQWLGHHAERQNRAEKVRKAIIARRVIRGMTVDEVRQALGDPEQVSGGESFGTDKQTWTYKLGGETRVVNFKDGEVLSTSTRRASRRR